MSPLHGEAPGRTGGTPSPEQADTAIVVEDRPDRGLEIGDLLCALEFEADERVAVLTEAPGTGRHTCRVIRVADATDVVAATAGLNVWFSVCPVDKPIDSTARGGAENVTRLSALWCDLDVKPGGCDTMEIAYAIIDDLSAVLGERPTVIVFSGHGLQPYWPVDTESAAGLANAAARQLEARFGRLVRLVASHHGAQVDSVFDISRMLRAPGTVNLKDPAEPVEVAAWFDTGGPMSVEQIRERLDEIGIIDEPLDTVGTNVVSDPGLWAYGGIRCGYTEAMTSAWATDAVSGKGRHPELLNHLVRQACAWRQGCIRDQDGLNAGIAAAGRRLAELCATTEPRRSLKPFEVEDAWAWAVECVSKKTDEEVQGELGHHVHDKPQQGDAPDDDGQADYLENAIRQRMGIMRIDREARLRLDDEDRPQVNPPPVKGLAKLLTEPETPTRYRIDKLAPESARIILSAQYKAGKTSLIGNLIRSLADGDPFLGTFTVNTPASRIVLIDDELSESTIRRWLRDQNITNTAAVVDVISLRGKVSAFNLLNGRCHAQWVTRLRDVGCDYLILDCLRPVLDSLGLDENHDAGKFLVAYDELCDQAGIADSMLVQHMGHSNERARGDSRLQDWPDATWRVVRETEDPDSARYFTAYGRDVNVAEGRLTFDPATRRIAYVNGARGDAKVREAYVAIIQHLAMYAKGDPPQAVSKNHIEGHLNEYDIPRKVVRAALTQAVQFQTVRVVSGPRGAQLHCIAYPCSECGLPVTTQLERHESCPSGPEMPTE